MAQDRRTKAFKRDREDRMKHPVGELMEAEEAIIEPTDKDVVPDSCIWCAFPIGGTKAICPHCKNCQACGMHQPQGVLDMCYLCGNKVPEKKIQEVIPIFKRMPGHRGLKRRSRPDVKFRSTRGRKPQA